MSFDLRIPDAIVQSIKLPEERLGKELMLELAVALYAKGFLSFGKARELAKFEKYEFGRILGEMNVPRHYGDEEFEDDLNYACGK